MISDKIRSRLQELGIRPIVVARKIGCSPQYLYELLRGEKRWNETMLQRVCDAIGLELELVPTGAREDHEKAI